MERNRFSVDALNSVDLSKIPAVVQTDLCRAAFDLVYRHRDDPGYKERFEKWLAEQKKNGRAECG